MFVFLVLRGKNEILLSLAPAEKTLFGCQWEIPQLAPWKNPSDSHRLWTNGVDAGGKKI